MVHLDAGRLAAAGHEVLVCTDRESLTSRPLPDALREVLEEFAFTPDEARAALGVTG